MINLETNDELNVIEESNKDAIEKDENNLGQISIKELKEKKIAFISLGCDKNRVDLEEMMYNLSSFGFTFTNSSKAEIAIINTCAFILPARKESIDNILEMSQLKKAGRLEKIIVTGCLPQRYLEELEQYLPEVDKFVPVKSNPQIVHIIAKLYGTEVKYTYKSKQMLIAPKHSAFLKIADGCNNCCTYCTIPRIRGRYISTPFNDIIARAKQLVESGAKELIVVAQDITRYGLDLYDKCRLVELLEELTKIKDLRWIRLHYCYPELVTDELLDLIVNNEKICPYIDIPLQHIDNKILKEMNRRSTEQECRDLITKIKTNYPEIAIRSTFIVGFPGETVKQFDKLCKFLKDSNLDNIGFFAFSREESTKAFYMKKQVPEFVKKVRLAKIEKIQENIATKNNLKKIGSTIEILIDKFNPETGYYEARSAQMSPNVDFYVNVPCDSGVQIGEFYNAKIVDYKDYAFLVETQKGEYLWL